MINSYTAIALGFLCALVYSGLLIVATVRSSFVAQLPARIVGSFVRIGIIVVASAYVLRSGLNNLILMTGVFFVSVWIIMIAYKRM